MTLSAIAIAIGLILALMPPSWWRAPVYLSLVASIVGGTVSVMGLPRPIETIWWEIDADVVAAIPREPSHIDIWTVKDADPLAIRLPYSQELHKQLRGAKDEAGEHGKVRFRYLDKQDGERAFHPEPVEALPPKS